MSLGERIASYRKKAGYSQEGLAEQLGVSRQAVSKWETGEATPDAERIIALAKVLGVTTDALLLGGGGARPRPSRRIGTANRPRPGMAGPSAAAYRAAVPRKGLYRRLHRGGAGVGCPAGRAAGTVRLSQYPCPRARRHLRLGGFRRDVRRLPVPADLLRGHLRHRRRHGGRWAGAGGCMEAPGAEISPK